MPEVVFVCDKVLERAENLKAVFEMYRGEKEFHKGTPDIPRMDAKVIVCDTLPPYTPDKKATLIVIGHGSTAGKLFGRDETRPGLDFKGMGQVDWLVCSSEWSVPIAARQYGIPKERVLPLGMPRTDAYFRMSKGDGGTPLGGKQSYLYVPTCRIFDDGGRPPELDWDLLDMMLTGNELFCIKRHYFDGPGPVKDWDHIIVADPQEPTTPYLIDCDVVITDYSTTVMDGYVAGKPSVLVTDDKEDYLSTRGMYRPYPSGYSSRAVNAIGNETGLLKALRAAVRTGLQEEDELCREETMGACDGFSAARVCELIGRCLCESS